MSTTTISPPLAARASTLARTAGVAVVLVGILVLLGWAFDVSAFKSIVPGLATMKANTALAIVLAGGALGVEARASSSHRRKLLSAICAAAAFLIGTLTLLEYAGGWQFGIDQLLVADPASPIWPGRMTLISALNCAMIGLALLLRRFPRASAFVRTLIFATLFTELVTL
ncbi:MAG TPA: hypothetical protein VFX76_08125, partial [Roseiflexaceae bacterium]|nr:hypothetical protein [Roseiflexaceae bacterium]